MAPAMDEIIHHAGAFQPINASEVSQVVDSGMSLVLESPASIQSLEQANPQSRARTSIIWCS